MKCIVLAHFALAHDWYTISLATIADAEWLVRGSTLCVIDSSQQTNAIDLCVVGERKFSLDYSFSLLFSFNFVWKFECLYQTTSVVDTSFSSGVKMGVKWKIMSIREEGVLEPCFELSRVVDLAFLVIWGSNPWVSTQPVTLRWYLKH